MNKKSPAYVLSFMAAICLVFGTGIAIVNYATQSLLARNAAMHRNRVLSRAFQLDVAGTSAEAYQQAVAAALRTNLVGGRLVYECVAPGKEAIGFVAAGMGFWDRIEIVVVLAPDLQKTLNVQVLDQKETPGLGARIEEAWFTDQFKNLAVAWDAPTERRIQVAANPAPNAANEVDAITGATQTSMALMRFLNDELAAFRTAYSPATRESLNPEP